MTGPEDRLIRFGVFELNAATGELRKSGIRLKLAEQPLRILHHLATRPGEIVTRDELRNLLWGADTFVDFEHGLNASINKIRESLGDSASTPRYIETVPRRGCRFIGELAHQALEEPKTDPESAPLPRQRRGKSSPWPWVGAVAVLLLAVAGGAWWERSRPPAVTPQLAMRPLTADAGLTTAPALSRDGKLVAYASDRATSKNLDIWVHPLTQGAQPIRVTKHEADEGSPDFSPDDGLIAFSSARDGGGIYLVPALGGEERLLVRGGKFPRFSPDGTSVAYCVGGDSLIQSRIYTISVSGGTPKELAADVPWACFPVFSSDGRHILFLGTPSMSDFASHDWWVTPVAGGPSVKTGAFEILREQLKIERIGFPYTDLADGWCVFALEGRIWELDLAGPGWKAQGPARPLTSGSTILIARAGAGSKMVFVNGQFARHLWKLKMDLNTGKVAGEMAPLPDHGGLQSMPSSSADGRLLAYAQEEPGGVSVRLRDLATSKETALVNSYARPKVSPDGSQIAYTVLPNSLYVMPSAGGEATRLVTPGEQVTESQIRGWTADGRRIVYWYGKPIRFALLDPETRESTDLIAHPKTDIFTLEMSPDQQWVAFATQVGAQWNLWIAACRNGKAVDEKDWILVNTGSDQRPWWSPDGNLLYTVSWRDGSAAFGRSASAPRRSHPRGNPLPSTTCTELG